MRLSRYGVYHKIIHFKFINCVIDIFFCPNFPDSPFYDSFPHTSTASRIKLKKLKEKEKESKKKKMSDPRIIKIQTR
jgi:hypothetical protein